MGSTTSGAIRIAYAGDRQIGRDVLSFIVDNGVRPLALMVPEEGGASHDGEILRLASFVDRRFVWRGNQFRSPAALDALRSLDLDYIVCVQFPLIVPREVLELPREGVLNLHPAYLPYNRGWHNSIWAILDRTPYGATLHFMNEQVDMGDIVHRKETPVAASDTGDILYKRARDLELEVFKEAWPQLAARTYTRTPQSPQEGSSHRRKDLHDSGVQRLDLDVNLRAGDLLDRLRALTTNRADEAAYFVAGGRRYRVRVTITPDDAEAK